MAIFHAEYFSQCLMRLVEAQVILPVEQPGVQGVSDRTFPTLYLLHGYTGRCADWLTGSCIAELARQYGLAVVMPSGENSFYEDDEEAGLLYSRFVGRELVELTRGSFPLRRSRADTWIAGLSMGGFGALLNGCRFADTFSAAACFSGAFILDDVAGALPDTPLRTTLGSYGYYRRVFGDLLTLKGSPRDPLYWAQKALAAGNLPRLYLSCGTEDSLFANGVSMRDQLRALGADVQWSQSPGEHTWAFWDQEIRAAVPWLMGRQTETKTKTTEGAE